MNELNEMTENELLFDRKMCNFTLRAQFRKLTPQKELLRINPDNEEAQKEVDRINENIRNLIEYRQAVEAILLKLIIEDE